MFCRFRRCEYAKVQYQSTGYNVYGKVIPISVEVTYLDTFANNTWVENAPADGYSTVTVTDTKLIVPQTGGYVQYVYLAGVISLLIGGAMFLVSRRQRDAAPNPPMDNSQQN